MIVVILKGIGWHLIMILIFISLILSGAGDMFIYLLALCLLWKMPFAPFYFCFAVGLCEFSMVCFRFHAPIRYIVCKYFPSVCRLTFQFVDCFFCCTKTLCRIHLTAKTWNPAILAAWMNPCHYAKWNQPKWDRHWMISLMEETSKSETEEQRLAFSEGLNK